METLFLKTEGSYSQQVSRQTSTTEVPFEIEGHAPQGDVYKNQETQESYQLDKVAMRPDGHPVFLHMG